MVHLSVCNRFYQNERYCVSTISWINVVEVCQMKEMGAKYAYQMQVVAVRKWWAAPQVGRLLWDVVVGHQEYWREYKDYEGLCLRRTISVEMSQVSK